MDAYSLWAEIDAAGRREARRTVLAADLATVCYLAAVAAVLILGLIGAVTVAHPVLRLLAYAVVAGAVAHAAVVVWRAQHLGAAPRRPDPPTLAWRLARGGLTGAAGIVAGHALGVLTGSTAVAVVAAAGVCLGSAAADRAVRRTGFAAATLARFAGTVD